MVIFSLQHIKAYVILVILNTLKLITDKIFPIYKGTDYELRKICSYILCGRNTNYLTVSFLYI